MRSSLQLASVFLDVSVYFENFIITRQLTFALCAQVKFESIQEKGILVLRIARALTETLMLI